MGTQHTSTIVHAMIYIWLEDGEIQYDEMFVVSCGIPELTLELPLNIRPTRDWVDEALNEIRLHEYILPNKFEVCEEPIFYEAIGEFAIRGWFNYWGEYDEEYNFTLHRWTCETE